MTSLPRPSMRRRMGWVKLRALRAAYRFALARYRPVAARRPTGDGVTVVTVSFNSNEQLGVLVDAVRRYSPPEIEILVVDNHSSDPPPPTLRDAGVRVVRLPLNVGHGPALDLAVMEARTNTVITLDVDAFPVAHGWLDSVLGPLNEGSSVAGAYVHRAYVHPCFCALRRRDFLDYRLSFVAVGRCPVPADPVTGLFLDVGEAMSHTLSQVYGSASIHKIPPSSQHGPGMIGTTFGEVVYHNFYSTHGTGPQGEAAAAAWRSAVERYVG